MAKLVIDHEIGLPLAPANGKSNIYFNSLGQIVFMGSDGIEHIVDSVGDAIADHVDLADPHTQYLTEAEADDLYAELAHGHNRAQTLVVCQNPNSGEFSSVEAALAAASLLTPSVTNRIVIRVFPGEYTESPFTVPGFVYIVGMDPWNSAHIKTNDNNSDFIKLDPNGGMFQTSITGPTTSGMSAIYQNASGITKLYWINLRNGYYGVTLKPTSGVARCHCIGVVTDSITSMNRVFNIDNPVGSAVFILMQSGSMSGSGLTYGLYLNGTTANAALDLCQFRISGSTAVYADGGSIVKGISTTFAGGLRAIHIGPNGSTQCDVHGSTIRKNAYTDDIKIESASAQVSFSGYATESKISNVNNAQLVASFADAVKGGQVIFGELFIGDKNVQTPLASYIQSDKNTGLVSGGGVSRGVGTRQVDIAAGSAFIDTVSGLKNVTWSNTTLTVAANSPAAWVKVDSAGSLSVVYFEPDTLANAVLAECGADATTITYLFDQPVKLPQFRPNFYKYLANVVGPINVSGGSVVADVADMTFDVDSSTYYLTEQEIVTSAGVNVEFTAVYRDGLGGHVYVPGQTLVDNIFYDDNGVLTEISTNHYVRHLLFAINNAGGTEFFVVYGQEEWNSEVAAVNNPIPPDAIRKHACRLAAFVVKQNTAPIHLVFDERPRLGQLASQSTSVTDHGILSYQVRSTAISSAISNADRTVYVTATGTTQTLPLASTFVVGQTVTIKLGIYGTVTIARSGADTIDAETSIILTGYKSSLDLIAINSTTWGII